MFSSNEIEANRVAEIRDKTIQHQHERIQATNSGKTDFSMFRVRHQGIIEDVFEGRFYLPRRAKRKGKR